MSIEASWTGSLLLPTPVLWGVPAQRHDCAPPLAPRATVSSIHTKANRRSVLAMMPCLCQCPFVSTVCFCRLLTAPTKPGASGSAPFPRSPLFTTNTTSFKIGPAPIPSTHSFPLQSSISRASNLRTSSYCTSKSLSSSNCISG